MDMLHSEWASLLGSVRTHGEVMRPLLEHVRRQRVPIVADREDEDWLLTKGSAWHLALEQDGHVVELHHEAPLPLPNCALHWPSELMVLENGAIFRRWRRCSAAIDEFLAHSVCSACPNPCSRVC